jgi:hypothetical protein
VIILYRYALPADWSAAVSTALQVPNPLYIIAAVRTFSCNYTGRIRINSIYNAV